jgi:hypothetical protein
MGSAFSIIKSNSNTNNESSEHLNNELSINKDNITNNRRSNRIFEASKKNITTFHPTKAEHANKNNHEMKDELTNKTKEQPNEIKEQPNEIKEQPNEIKEQPNEIKEDECNKILDKLEDDGYKKLGELKNNENIKTSEDLGNALMNIIKDGASEFEKKAGRPMSYAEMRYAYG